MTLSPTLLLVALLPRHRGIFLVGGLLPNWVRMTHTRTQSAMSFVSGLMLGVAFFHLLPTAWLCWAGPGRNRHRGAMADAGAYCHVTAAAYVPFSPARFQ